MGGRQNFITSHWMFIFQRQHSLLAGNLIKIKLIRGLTKDRNQALIFDIKNIRVLTSRRLVKILP